jgi:hypothetical protein
MKNYKKHSCFLRIFVNYRYQNYNLIGQSDWIVSIVWPKTDLEANELIRHQMTLHFQPILTFLTIFSPIAGLVGFDEKLQKTILLIKEICILQTSKF